MRFSGWTAIVTGGGYGIGRAIALALGKEGANVALAARSREKLEAVAATLRAMGTSPGVYALSVADEPAVEAMVRAERERTGRLDVLVNNSGIGGPTRSVRDITADEWREVLDVNLTGAFFCAKHAARVMIEQKRGVIVNIGSVAGRIAYPLRSPYAASKWGMIGLNHSLAAELGRHGIRVNAVLPGSTEGERMQRSIAGRAAAENISLAEAERWFLKDQPIPRMSKPEEIAAAVLFLASDDAATITGQTLNVDSGFRMQ
jgi:NAD(P)-dependent dehydrogenase (short-subunit alcohol dehydrogenase family)